MKIPLSWLREYVDIDLSSKELAHRLTMAGIEVGEVTVVGGWTNCVVGHVEKVEPVPNADRLTMCTVNSGDGDVQVVCGAPNVAAGQRIAYAGIGARLFNPHSGKTEALKAARIRGVTSQGMICSELELGLSNEHTGILVLPEDAPVGMDLTEYMGDEILELELTPNRFDCMSVLGVAHEVAALTGRRVREPDLAYPEDGGPVEGQASVEVGDPDLCPRYTATLIRGITIGPSPKWLQERLSKAGMRPINNVVDITNYVMLEYNQPLHAFDFGKVAEGKIIVRRAMEGEVLVSLDGTERKLSTDMLVIADPKGPVGLAGVMGGANSEMTDGTTDVFLESATFDAGNNRRTSQALGMPTEASARFEKGLKPDLAPLGLARATQLIQQIAGGTVAKGILDAFPAKDSAPSPLRLRMSRLEKILGVSFPMEQVVDVLVALGFEVESEGERSLLAKGPYWRGDIAIEDDLVEEVARIVGYEAIPTTMLSTPIPAYLPQPMQQVREGMKDHLVALGMQEVITYSLTNLEELSQARALEAVSLPLRVANPLSSHQEHLRTTLRSGLLSTAGANISQGAVAVAIFESGRVYLPRAGDLPVEREMIAGVLCGPRGEAHWLGDDEPMGYLDAKGVLERLFEGVGTDASFQPSHDSMLTLGTCAEISIGGTPVGILGEVDPGIAASFQVEGYPLAFFELDVEAIVQATPAIKHAYKPISRFPSAVRDLSIVVEQGVSSAQVQEIIQKQRLVERVQLFDVYEGENIPAGKRSLAYHLYFQASDRTLTSDEVQKALQGIIRSLEHQVNAELRA